MMGTCGSAGVNGKGKKWAREQEGEEEDGGG